MNTYNNNLLKIRERQRKRALEIKQRRREIRYKIVLTVLTVFLCTFLSLAFKFNKSKAETGQTEVYYKYYKSIDIHYGDTLTSISKNYYNAEFDTIKSFMREIISINCLSDSDCINEGDSLVIPYYSTEFK